MRCYDRYSVHLHRFPERHSRTRAEGFGAEVKRRILVGTYVLSHGYYDAYYLQAQKIRRLVARDFQQAFTQVDFICGPTAPTTAFELGARTSDPVQMYLGDVFTIPAPLAGLPALSIPCGFDEKGLADPEQAQQEIAETEPPSGAGRAQEERAARGAGIRCTVDQPDEHRQRDEQHRRQKERRHSGGGNGAGQEGDARTPPTAKPGDRNGETLDCVYDTRREG